MHEIWLSVYILIIQVNTELDRCISDTNIVIRAAAKVLMKTGIE